MKKYDLTNPQKSIWVTEEFYKGTSIENIAGLTTIHEEIDFGKLKEAINIFTKNTESFRLKFVNENNQIKQYISDYEEMTFEVVTVKSEKDVKKLGQEFASTPLEIFDSLMFKFKLFKFEDGHGGFIVVGHHLFVDAWACGIVVSSVVKIYDMLKKGIKYENELFSYIDYIESEQEYMKSPKFEKDKTFWHEQFKEVPEPATIPGSLNETGISSRAKRKQFKIPAETMELVNTYCKNNKISPYNFFMGAYSLYLARVSGLDEFVIGTPVLNRSNIKEKHTIGMFISVVPFKVKINHEESFSEFAKQISSNFFNIFRHQKYPYQTLLEDLRKENKKIPNLYNILLSYQNMRTETKSTDVSYATQWLFNGNNSDDLDIHFFDINDSGIINVAYDYKTSKYTSDDIYSLHSRLLHIMNQILDNNEILLKDIDILTPDEKEEVLYRFNETIIDYPKDKTISQLFEEQVEKTPNNIALVFEDQELTYKALNERANSLAYYLRQKGVGRDDLIGIMVNRSLEMIVSILAVLKAGGAYIPIDPSYPQERVEYMLKNGDSKFLLTQKHLKDKVNFKNKIFVDLNNNDIYSLPSINLENINKPEDLSYVIFTSGSTGLPKGVMLKHKSLSNLTAYCNNYIEYLKHPSYQAVVSITTVSFDIFIFETLISLQKGLKLIIANENEQTIPEMLGKLILKHNVKIMQSTPSRMQLILNNLRDFSSINNLDYITLAGEQLPITLANRLHQLSDIIVYNGYGPSETTVFSTLTKMDEEIITIGKPLFNTQIYILDKSLRPVPIGIAGELYIAGDGVGRGYLNNKELTDKSFINNPFIPNTIMYKTGDLGVFCKDGKILCLGRSDNQIKIRGLRIELGEIEEKLSEIPAVKACAVIKKVDNSSHEFLCAYYTSDEEISVSQIRKHLQKYLPDYMVPQFFTRMDKLPYTPNGKIDNKKLPLPEIKIEEKNTILPRNEIDKKLIDILEELLNVRPISIDDNFFELGGDSLSAINLCTQIQGSLNTQVFVKDILENPIIQDLADIISRNLDNLVSDKITCVKKADYYPVSSAQKRMYFASSIAGEKNVLYNISGGVILKGKIDYKKLEKCFKTLVNRHESLRTYFELQDGNVVQKIAENINFKLEYLENSKFNELDNLFNEFVRPFNLSKAPLLRARFVDFGKDKSALFVDMHHIISDGASLSILVQELCKLYNDEVLPEINITYKDFSAFESKNLTSGDLKEAEQFWVQKFKEDEVPVLNLPTKSARPATQSFDGKRIHSSINLETTNKIESLAKNLGVTPYMVLLGAYYVLLSKYTSQDDIVIGTPVVGRDNTQINNIIGMFVNSLAIRENVDRQLSFKKFLKQLKDDLLDSYKYQTFPFDELVNKLNISRDPSRNPLFDTMFTYQNNGYTSFDFNGIKSKYYIPDTGISKFDLSVEVIPNENGLDLSFEYATKLFDEEFIKAMSNHYLNIINTVLENIDIKISEIDMMEEEEKNRILYEFNNTKNNYPKDKTIIKLFEEQVKKTPEKIAIVFENQELTYKQLNEKANGLAHYLKNIINKNDTVGIMLNRSFETVISILAVLKTGGIYTLLDNTLPADRISYILQNCKAKILIVDDDYNIDVDIDTINILEQENLNDFNNSKKYSNLSNDSSPLDNFAIIYTSGSTGKPKGVLLHNTGIVNLVYSFKDVLELSSYHKHLGFAAVSFDMFAVELFSSILLGRTLYLLNDEEIKNPIAISNIIIKNNIDFVICTPTKMELLLSNEETSKCLRKLKGIQLGGEIFTPELYSRISKITKAKIHNGYGPTEITACCSDKLVTSEDDINIGTPIANTQIYILDQQSNLCPINIPGELCVSGVGISNGYIYDEEKTSKVFVKSRFNDCILYKTGDIAYYDTKGDLHYIGRNDLQVKINGLRIELSEIEKQFCSIPDISSCVVIADKARTYLKAFFVGKSALSIPSIRKRLSEKLPLYMIPKYIEQLDQIPTTPNGKIDRIALNNLITTISEDTIEYVKPENALQEKFCKIWEQILGVKVGIDNDFFELGADSLSAIKFKVEALNEGINVSYADIFKFKTVRKLSTIKPEEIETIPIENFNYDKINKLLSKNKIRYNYKFDINTNNNVLLLGSNGFVGMHIIDSFIKNDTGTIYCLMRDKNGKGAQNRFLEILHFYYGNSLDSYVGNRIVVLKGDILKENFGLSQRNYSKIIEDVSVVINTAANVKHFGDFNKFKNINIDAINRTIDFCSKYSKRLIHLSTLSVSGNMFLDNTISKEKLVQKKKVYFTERNLFIDQSLDNVYTRSKFEAEKIVLDCIESGDIDGIVLRLGNITSRFSDGRFQINPDENAFTSRLRSFVELGTIPKSLLNKDIEFTPVDLCADSIIKCMQYYDKSVSVLHIYNRNHVKIHTILSVLKEFGVFVKALNDTEFAKYIDTVLSNTESNKYLNGIVNDFTTDKKLIYDNNIYIKSDFSINYLLRCKFKWSKINRDYIIKYITYLKSIGFFNN